MANFPPGTYRFKIVGEVGEQSDFTLFDMVILDICGTLKLELTPQYFSNQVYKLGDDQMKQEFTTSTMVSYQEGAVCGDIIVEFFSVGSE